MSSVSSKSAAPAASVSNAEIDASCRGPVTLMFFSSVTWLALAALFSFLATMKFHKPSLLAHCPIFTFGRVDAVASTIFLYGFAVQTGLAVSLWLLGRLGRVTLQAPMLANLGTIFWNFGVTTALVGLLGGDLTGYEGFEVPRYTGIILFASLVVLGASGLVTFARRTVHELYPSQWFILAALVWLPWILSTAVFLLHLHPVRGVMQAVVHWWYANNLNLVWLGLVGMSVVFYLLPKLSGRPLQSRYLAMFVLWTLTLFGSWGGIPSTAPLPSWMPGVSTMATLLTLVPVLAAVWSCQVTLGADGAKNDSSGLIRFLVFGVAALVVGQLMAAANSISEVSRVTEHTYFVMAQSKLVTYGFFAMVMFAAILHIAPRLADAQWPSPKLVSLIFWCGALGVVFYALPLAIGGFQIGRTFNEAEAGRDLFQRALANGLAFFRFSALGDLLMLVAAFALAGSFKLMIFRRMRACCQAQAAMEAGQTARATT